MWSTGPGIHPDKHELIFKRFRQLDYSSTKRYGGTGLGLAIIKGLVELMHGKIWLESETGEGPNFILHYPIPLYICNLKRIQQNRATGQHDWSSKTILIVEDEHTNYNLLNIMLRPTKVSTLWARRPQAIDMVQANKQIDLILMDIRMPNVDGYMATIE